MCSQLLMSHKSVEETISCPVSVYELTKNDGKGGFLLAIKKFLVIASCKIMTKMKNLIFILGETGNDH